MIGLELLDLVDENGVPTGEVKERELVHRDGDRHRISHVWLFRQRNGRWQVLLQKRSEQKDSHPGCYDISSAGHIPAGVDWVSSALRELEEELGLHMQAEQLHLAGVRRFDWRGSFYGRPFRDRQVSRVYYGVWEGEPQDLHLQESEVSEVVWMDFAACRQAVTANAIPHCIFSEELDLLAQALRIPEESNRDCCKK